MTRLAYPLDIPLGARLVREGVLVREVTLVRLDGHGAAVAILGDDDAIRVYDPGERLEIDEDTLERRTRLAFAARILDSGLTPLDPPTSLTLLDPAPTDV